MPSVAINGLGRIGRAALKILVDADGLELVAVNDIADADSLARRAANGRVTVLYAARDREHNNAVVLAELLRDA
jgi:glyceraldehyde-3-phosphate dehydrogenase/erythrose-4-phosphate dehydrogenase